MIYKICKEAEWAEAKSRGELAGSVDDMADGVNDLSTAKQEEETARRHFGGQPELVVAAFDPEVWGGALNWELSRGGDLFPHLYGPLPASAALSVLPLQVGVDGTHVFPSDIT